MPQLALKSRYALAERPHRCCEVQLEGRLKHAECWWTYCAVGDWVSGWLKTCFSGLVDGSVEGEDLPTYAEIFAYPVECREGKR